MHVVQEKEKKPPPHKPHYRHTTGAECVLRCLRGDEVCNRLRMWRENENENEEEEVVVVVG